MNTRPTMQNRPFWDAATTSQGISMELRAPQDKAELAKKKCVMMNARGRGCNWRNRIKLEVEAVNVASDHLKKNIQVKKAFKKETADLAQEHYIILLVLQMDVLQPLWRWRARPAPQLVCLRLGLILGGAVWHILARFLRNKSTYLHKRY